MSNGEVCCILGVCCPPAARRQSAVDHLKTECGCSEEMAGKVFDWFDDRVAFAPKEFQETIDKITHLAKRHAKSDA